MDYTFEQSKAINCLDKDLVVVAGAGAGKTRVLVDRLINILKSKRAKIDEIAAITYTEKAALEIKERVRDALDKEIEDGNTYLKEAKDKLGISMIGTIHRFCLDIIKQNPVEAGIDTDISIMDDTKVNELRDTAVSDVIKTKLTDERVYRLIKSLSYNSFYAAVKDIFIKIRNTGMDIKEIFKVSDTQDKKLIADIVYSIDKEYADMKKRMDLIDFEDMLVKTYEIFVNYGDVLKYYRKRLKYILVDEYQDLNYIQDKLIRLMDTGKNLFVVGDKKQSIYRFRGARVELFDRLYNDLASKGQSVSLDTNFRSLPGIIEFVNGGFKNIIDDYGEMKAYRENRKENFQVEYMVSSGKGVNEKKSAEALKIADKIIALLNEGYKTGDIAILVNKRTHIRYYTKELEKRGLPYHVIMNGGLFDNIFVMDILNAMTAVSTQDIIYIYSVLTNIFGISDDVFSEIILEKKDLNENDLRSRGDKELNKFLDIYDGWLFSKDILNLTGLVKKIIDDGSIYSACYKKGEQAVSDVLKFEDIVRKYDKMGYNLEMFLDEIKKYKEESEAQISRDDSDVVKFITIHSSKGLQFPVVIFADASSDFHRFSGGSILFEPDIGLAIKGDADYDTVKNKIIHAETEEYKRLLYVVLTRAKDRLIISANVSGLKNSFSSLIENNFNVVNDQNCDDMDLTYVNDLKSPVSTQTLKYNEFDRFKPSQSLSYSISSIMDFLRCNRKFMIYYLYGINEDDFKERKQSLRLEANDIGNIVHGIIERSKDMPNAMSELALLKNKIEGSDFTYIKNCLNNYYNSIFSSYKNYISEYSFALDIGNLKSIKGRIDRFYNDNGRIILADFKTNSHIDNDLFELYNMQVQIYAVSLMKMGLNVTSASLFDLHENKIHKIDIAAKVLEDIQSNIRNAVNMIENEKDIRKFKASEKACRFCEYQDNICRYLGGTANNEY